MNIALIGYGYWGKNLARNFNAAEGCTLAYLVEPDIAKQESFSKLYPSVKILSSTEDLYASADLDAVVIATPVDTHYPLAKEALLADKHVLVEKPLTSDVDKASELVDLANKNGLLLMVDHTFLYTGAVQKIKSLIEDGSLGNVQYIDSTRINLGLFQHDVNVLWDLAPHDISMCLYWLSDAPKSISAIGASHTSSDLENIAYLTLKFENDLITHFNCSWVSPVKIRQMLIGGDKQMVLFNDMEPSEKVKIYDTGYEAKTEEEINRMLVDYRTGDVYIPQIERTEALKLMAQDFVDSIREKRNPISSAEIGLEVVRILDAAQVSIKSNGKEILL